MKNRIKWIAVVAMCAAAPAAWANEQAAPEGPVRVAAEADVSADRGIGQRIADFRYAATDGRVGKLSQLAASGAVVIAIHDIGCPVSAKYAPRLQEIEALFADKGAQFLFLNSFEYNTRAEVNEFLDKRQFIGPYVFEPAARIGSTLGLKTTTEVLVLDDQLTLRYRGAVDDQNGIGFTKDAPTKNYLVDAIQAVLAGNDVPVPATTAPGCEVDFDSDLAKGQITYHNRISTIVNNNCVQCHREGSVGPFALDSYSQVKGRRKMIQRVVEDGIMPPWHASKETGPYENDRSLSELEKKDLLAWIANDTPEGDPADAPEFAAFPDPNQWQIGDGKPDAVFEIPNEFRVPAQGTVNYKYTFIQTNFKEDKWVVEAQVRPTSPQVVHHVLTFLEEPLPEGADPRQARRQFQGGLDGYFIGHVPGAGATVFPKGTAKKLPAGARIIVQIHYTANGEATTDKTQIAFKFADAPPETEMKTGAVAQTRFRIPPSDGNHQVMASGNIPAGTIIYGFSPHMHVRGKAFKYELQYEDGTKQLVLDVPKFDFNWQTMYRLSKPLVIDKPARMIGTAWFDNSPENPANPDPTAWVRFGEQTWDEMMIGYFEYSRLPKQAASE